jgi:4-hydroxybenzoate polyprenyltransferase
MPAACKQGGNPLHRGMVNPFWFWRGLMGNSVTFALLFASLLLGASIAGGFQKLLASLGVHWLYVVLIPIFLFSWLSRKESQWLPDEGQRKLYARSLILGSIAAAILIAWLRP